MSNREVKDLVQVQPEDFERAFREETEELLRNRLRLGLGVGILLYLSFSVLDWFVVGEHWAEFLAIRVGVCALVGAILALQVSGRAKGLLIPTSFIQILAGSLGISAMTWVSGGFETHYYFGNMLVLFLVGLFIPWPVRLTAFLCSVALVGYAVPNLFLHPLSENVLLPIFFLIGTAVLTCWATQASEVSRRRDLWQRLQLGSVNEQLTLADEMKTRFFSNVSHELRTPLMLILGPLDSMIRGEYAGNQGTLLQAMNSNAHRLLRQVNMILNFSRLEAGRQKVNWAPGNVSAVIEELVTAALPYAEKRKIDLRMEGVDALPDNYFDSEQIETVTANLLSNAMKFTPDGGRITVRGGRDGELLYWEVEDSGCGIPEKDVAKVFERFHQVDGGKTGKIQGTGLGLSLSRELVQLHKGDIVVSSVLGEGTTFRVTLPIAPPEGVEPGIAEGPEPEADGGAGGAPSKAQAVSRGPTGATQFADLAGSSLEQEQDVEAPEQAPLLLLVEDNPDMRGFVANSLRHHYRVVTAEDGRYGVEAARKHRPDMIVSDVMMPRLDGFGMVEELRKDKTFENTPILMLTARTGSEAVVKGLSLGAVDYVNKPFKMIELKARIGAQLRASQAEKALDERESRLVAVGQMTGTIAHDLRGPLTAILGRIDLVRIFSEAKGTLGDIQEDLDSVERTVFRVTNMAQELVEFVRGGNVSLELEQGDAASFLRMVDREMSGPLKESGIELILETDAPELLEVRFDSHRLQRVVENLVNNARDAVNGVEDAVDKRIWLQARRDGDQVLIRVADNGPGIPAEVADRLFQPFATAGKASGTGLGLSIVRNLVTAHAGTIEVDHHPPEGGAAFELRLPALAGAQALGADEHPRAAEGAAGTASGEQDDPLPSPEQAPGERQSTRPGDGA